MFGRRSSSVPSTGEQSLKFCARSLAHPLLGHRDVTDSARRVATPLEGLRDILSSVFEVGNLLEQQRQGVITRKLAAWSVILAAPTAIAGIYGMNSSSYLRCAGASATTSSSC
jgi:hypothetical protein